MLTVFARRPPQRIRPDAGFADTSKSTPGSTGSAPFPRRWSLWSWQLQEAGDRIEVAGLFTHFADAGADSGFTVTQHTRFLDAVELIRPVAPNALLHTSGSAAVLAHPAMHHDMVRVGIAFYGYPPVPGPNSLRLAMHVFCRIAQVRTVAPGETVGYGRTWRADTPRRIATATMGYGQGLPRSLSNVGHLAIRGRRCPIVGVVSMDQVSIDVTDIDGVDGRRRGDVHRRTRRSPHRRGRGRRPHRDTAARDSLRRR